MTLWRFLYKLRQLMWKRGGLLGRQTRTKERKEKRNYLIMHWVAFLHGGSWGTP